ncbi:hypothetical protein ACIPL1_19650 [Pseudomonas sp. NPDC090202]|uniref:hypothetical protein n=1 Tax=unclassified Pseudomonas TaxID=196821 RepID=UPI003815CE50
MNFVDMYVNREERFSIGIEKVSGKFYVSFPVRNDMIDYEEYYEIDRAQYDLYQKDPNAALVFVTRCRHRELDELLIQKPGSKRGTAI